MLKVAGAQSLLALVPLFIQNSQLSTGSIQY